MSTFNGEIKEIPGVSVDHFDNKSLKCYFLSHCHSDHMSGLSSLQTDSPVYTTAISALFIQQKCPQLSENLIILEPGIPTSIRLTQNCETFVVTALSAGHCAGSCMLLFQKENCDILYTGDFRISLKNAKNIKIFEDIRDSTIYLDSTFLSTKFPQFPSQAESVKEILEIVQNFLTKSTHHKVHLKVPARYGYEYLLMSLSSKLNEKIHIQDPEVFEQYSSISLLDSCVTSNNGKARIILKSKHIKENILKDENTTLIVELSAMFWRNWTGGSFTLKTTPNSIRVCYATHNSFHEIRDFLLYLKPKKVYLNVEPGDAQSKLEMMNQLALIQKVYLHDETIANSSNPQKFAFKRLRSKAGRREAQHYEKKVKER